MKFRGVQELQIWKELDEWKVNVIVIEIKYM